MGFTKRFGRIIKANLNDALAAAEDPNKQLELLISEMEDGLRQAKVMLVRALADEKRLQRQLDETEDLVRLWQDKAQQAVEVGQDDLARQALRKKRTYDELAQELDEQLLEQQQAVDQLREQYKRLEQRLEQARVRRRDIGAERVRRRHQDAEEERRPRARPIDASALTNTRAFDKFDEMADKVENLEAETEAAREIEEMLEGDDELAAAIDRAAGRSGRSSRGRASRPVDDEALKVDIELEQMRRRAGRGRGEGDDAAPKRSADETPERTPRQSRRRTLEVPEDIKADPADDAPVEDDTQSRKPELPDDDDDKDGGDSGWGRRVEL